jgi:excisionase family DNA binding protein
MGIVEKNVHGNVGLLTTEQVATRLGLAAQTLRLWRVRSGRGPVFLKLGTRVRYAAEDVNRWLEARAFCSTAQVLESKRAKGGD